jgi:multiple sugar transport system substrate-binding protein
MKFAKNLALILLALMLLWGIGNIGAAPGEKIVLKVIDWSDSSRPQRDAFHKTYTSKVNPNVTIDYTLLTQDQYKNTMMTMLKSGDMPDLFPVPIGMTLATAVAEGWYLPMGSYMPASFLDTFDDNLLVEGTAKINGKLYTLPEKAPITAALFFYNKKILREAGVSVPKTYSEFIKACKTITEKGKGQYYGLIDGGKQIDRLNRMALVMASLAGAKIGTALPTVVTDNHRATFDCPQMVSVFDVFAQLQKDGSIHPDTMNISAPEARQLFGNGEAAFICQGSWCIATWAQNNPDLEVGVMAPPVPDTGRKGAIPADNALPWLGISAKSKHPAEAAEYLRALFSEGYEKELVSIGERFSVLKGVNEKYLSNPASKEYYRIGKELTLPVPTATQRDPNAFKFYVEVKGVQPSLGNLLQGVMSGSLANYKAALAKLADDSTVEWKRAATSVGLDFNVFEFPNWDVSKAYLDSDYAKLPKLK